MRSLVDRLRGEADLVVLDSPPVLAVTDALVLTGVVDAVLLVVSRRRTSRRATELALRLLGNGIAPVVGIVLNRSSHVHLEPSRYYGRGDAAVDPLDTGPLTAMAREEVESALPTGGHP